MICKKCLKIFNELEEHHVWCKFMDNPQGYTFKDGQPNRYNLCTDCHKELHQKLIIPELNKLLETLKFNGSQYWLWKMARQEDKPRIILSITESTIKWVENKDDSL